MSQNSKIEKSYDELTYKSAAFAQSSPYKLMKKILALIFCIFLVGCASKPSVKNLNLKSSLNYGRRRACKDT